MDILYVDSCVLLEAYVNAARREEVSARLDKAAQIFTSSLTYAEVLAVLGRMHLNYGLRASRYERACDHFLEQWDAMIIVPFDLALPEVRRLTGTFSLKGADAIHLASAVCLEQIRTKPLFLTLDRKLSAAASQSGLKVWPPELAG